MYLKDIASFYYSMGFNVTGISNHLTKYNFYTVEITKSPYHPYDRYFFDRQLNETFADLDFSEATGIGTVTGFNNLLVIDIDGCTERSALHKICNIINIPINYEWIVQSGSKTGFHIYLKVPYPTDEEKSILGFNSSNLSKECWTFGPGYRTFDFEKLEFLWRTHVVLPPSLHKSSYLYEFINCNFPKNPPLEFLSFSKSNLHRLLHRDIVTTSYGPHSQIHILPPAIIPSNSSNKISDDEFKGEILCFLDIETDGLINKEVIPKITQISWCLVKKIEDSYNNFYYPLLKKQTYLINNLVYNKEIVDLQSNLNTSNFQTVGQELYKALSNLKEDLLLSKSIIAYNVDFDLKVLNHHFEKYDLNFKLPKVYCLMKTFSKIYPTEKYYKLSELHELLFGFNPKILHNAVIDVLITVRCFKKLLSIHWTFNYILMNERELSEIEIVEYRERLGDLDGAINFLQNNNLTKNKGSNLFIKLPVLLIKNKEYKKALRIIEDTWTDIPYCFFIKAVIEMNSLQYQEAIEHFLRFLQIENIVSDYRRKQISKKLSFCYFKIGNLQEGKYYDELESSIWTVFDDIPEYAELFSL